MGMNLYLIIRCDSMDGPWETDVYHSWTEALERLETEHENLFIEDKYGKLYPQDKCLEIELDPDEGTLSWIDADTGCKHWVCIEEVYLNHAKEVY